MAYDAPPDYVDAVTADELKVVESERANIIKVESARGPPYLAKVELRKETWGKVCKMLEGGQVRPTIRRRHAGRTHRVLTSAGLSTTLSGGPPSPRRRRHHHATPLAPPSAPRPRTCG